MKVKDFLEEYASHIKCKLNPEDKIRNLVIKKLEMNYEEFGFMYCPCKFIKNQDTVCPCKGHREDIEKNGHCDCHLFIKEQK